MASSRAAIAVQRERADAFGDEVLRPIAMLPLDQDRAGPDMLLWRY